MRALDGKERIISKNAVDVLNDAGPAEFMAAILQSVRSVGLIAADHAHIRVDHLFLSDCQGLDEVHQEIKGFLDVQCASFQEESHCVSL